MERRQFFTECRYCGKQILMTRNVDTGRYTPCDSLVHRFFPDEDSNDFFINEDGKQIRGFSNDVMGHIGYKKHSESCSARNRT